MGSLSLKLVSVHQLDASIRLSRYAKVSSILRLSRWTV